MRMSIPVEKRLDIHSLVPGQSGSLLETQTSVRHGPVNWFVIVKEVCLVTLEELFKKKVYFGNEVGSIMDGFSKLHWCTGWEPHTGGTSCSSRTEKVVTPFF
ncbi:UNVERIFIED_CONTAM: hypothetical protein K2H54_056946 [Gekko kuhli]